MLVPDISELAHIIELETRESLEDLCETLAIGENPAADMQRFLTELSEGIAKAILRALESVNASDESNQ
jgi:hypothetical protein